MTYKVSEIFDSIQGEGLLGGMPSTFIRLAGCNLSCSWCDAAYTWKGDVKFDEYDLDELVAHVNHEHVVVTGGEPLIHDGIYELFEALDSRGLHVTVETNGTIFPHSSAAMGFVQLYSVSPKLGTSGQVAQLDMRALNDFAALGPNGVQFKFVASDEEDYRAALELLRNLDVLVHGTPLFVQPNGLCHTAVVTAGGHARITDQDAGTRQLYPGVEKGPLMLETPYLDRVRWLYELVEQSQRDGSCEFPIRAVVQAHKLAWGNRRSH